MPDYPQLIDELLATVALIEVSPDVFEGKSHDYVGARIFWWASVGTGNYGGIAYA